MSEGRSKRIPDDLRAKALDGLASGKAPKDIAAETGLRIDQVYFIKRKFDESQKELDSAHAGEKFDKDLDGFSAEKSMDRSFKRAVRILEQALQDAEDGYEIRDETNRRVPIKTIMECIERAGKYITTMKKSGISDGSEQAKIDYVAMAKLYTTFNPKTGLFEYDERAHMEAVIEEVYNREKDRS